MRVAASWLVDAGIVRVEVTSLAVLFGQQLLDFPSMSLDTDTEFEVFLRDRIPVL